MSDDPNAELQFALLFARLDRLEELMDWPGPWAGTVQVESRCDDDGATPGTSA